MTMRNQDEIDVPEPGDFGLRIFENRIREPRIDEQNFSARGHNLESRLTVPSELRIHGKSRNPKASVHQEKRRFGEVRFLKFSTFIISSSFDIRHSTFYLSFAS